MKTVRITEAFTGYPNDKERRFEVGDEPELSNDYADLVVDKGHAKLLDGAQNKDAEK